MADEDLLGDGNIKVTICTALSSVSLPPVGELNAGVDIQHYLMKDGLDIDGSESPVDNSALDSKGETERRGTTKYGIKITGKIKKVKAENVGYNTLVPGLDCWLAVRRDKDNALPWEVDDDCEIYPVECGSRIKQKTALNEVQKWISTLYNHTDADVEAVVAA